MNEQDIVALINEMDDDKGAGTDGLPSPFVKMAAPALIFPLMLIFNASLAVGVFPILVKSTLIHPVFKAGRNNDVNNYRPSAVLLSGLGSWVFVGSLRRSPALTAASV